MCSLCEQRHHGVVGCALGWACWKTYVGRPETHVCRRLAMAHLANGLHEGGHYEDALSVRETDLAMIRRIGAPEEHILNAQSNLANSYQMLHMRDETIRMRRNTYAGWLKLHGEEHRHTIVEASNLANLLLASGSRDEARSILRKMIPVAQRSLGEDRLTLRMRSVYAVTVCDDDSATLDELRETVTSLVETERTARRVLGAAHPVADEIRRDLERARATLSARVTRDFAESLAGVKI